MRACARACVFDSRAGARGGHHVLLGANRELLPSRALQCATFTGMRDLRESNNLQKRINSGIYTISIPDTTLKQSIKLYAGITTISIISKDIQGYKYMDIHGYPGQPAHEGY